MPLLYLENTTPALIAFANADAKNESLCTLGVCQRQSPDSLVIGSHRYSEAIPEVSLLSC